MAVIWISEMAKDVAREYKFHLHQQRVYRRQRDFVVYVILAVAVLMAWWVR